ncbi:hypothetical protein [Oryza sativa Japonica Group]|uniref:Uncharacterized protein n=1 Tax=Oryza sativa subsp. japonica TaxID=39947 RepID=Q5N9U0_ORYSJ|nr:hypothetical protein [Oryza sativa Japonica Group]BAD81766.1 hypothetical protein [Oryza sativa Japonica Group]
MAPGRPLDDEFNFTGEWKAIEGGAEDIAEAEAQKSTPSGDARRGRPTTVIAWMSVPGAHQQRGRARDNPR